MLTPSSFLKGAVAALVVMFVSDAVWHGMLMADFYNTSLSVIPGAHTPSGFPAFIFAFELVGACGLAYFVLKTSHTVMQGTAHGALLGLMMICAINLVNHDLIPVWPVNVVAVDILWGVVTGALAGAAARVFAGKR